MFALAAFVACVPPALLHFVGRNEVYFGGNVHFFGVALGALVATVSAAALTVVPRLFCFRRVTRLEAAFARWIMHRRRYVEASMTSSLGTA